MERMFRDVIPIASAAVGNDLFCRIKYARRLWWYWLSSGMIDEGVGTKTCIMSDISIAVVAIEFVLVPVHDHRMVV